MPDGIEIVIQRRQDRAAHAIEDPAGMLYLHELRQALEHIAYCIDDANAPKNQSRLPWRKRVHRNVGILGPRGVGKTSFLLTLFQLLHRDGPSQVIANYEEKLTRESTLRQALDKYRQASTEVREKGKRENLLDGIRSKIEVIHLIEPSLMEHGDHVVVAVFSALLDATRRLLEEKASRNPALAEELLGRAQELIRNLPAILVQNRLLRAYEREDIEGLTEEVMNFRSGLNVELSFGEFVAKYLELSGKKLVLFGIDDVDMAFERGEQVLESLRRYLTCPGALFLVSGDLSLFGKVLFGQFYKELGGPRAEGVAVVEELVEHYLKKILPMNLRVHLPGIRPKEIDRIWIVGSEEKERVKAEKVYREMLEKLYPGRRGFAGGAERLAEVYRFLIPTDPRHFIEFFDPPLVDGDLLFKIADIWREQLDGYGLRPEKLQKLLTGPRIGLSILNHLLEGTTRFPIPLDLDPRTLDDDANLAAAFLLFTLQKNLSRRRIPSMLGVGLDYCVPARLLSHETGPDRIALQSSLRLQQADAQRNLYQRIIPWIARKGLAVSTGVARLAAQPGAFDKLLDCQDDSPRAEWRTVLGDPRRRDLPAARSQAALHAREYLEQSGAEACPVMISGVEWATHYLPSLLERAVAKLTVKAPEMLPDAVFFEQLAGALPRLILQTWKVNVQTRFYLSNWHGLAVLRTIGSLAREFFEERPGLVFERATHEELARRVREDIRRHLEPRSKISGGSTERRETDELRTPPSTARDIAREFDRPIQGETYRRLLGEIQLAGDARNFYPHFGPNEKWLYHWPVPTPRPPLLDGKPVNGHPWTDTREIRTWNELQSARGAAWDGCVQSISTLVTDWVELWMTWLQPENLLRKTLQRSAPDFIQIQRAMNAFLDDVSHEEQPAGKWSGAGDILQRWVLTFLNDVLVETLELVDAGGGDLASPEPIKPHLEHLTGSEAPVRGVRNPTREGTNHPLYPNLVRLELQPKTGRRWEASEAFLLLATFPLIAVFLPRGGPIPRLCMHCFSQLDIEEEDYCGEHRHSMESPDERGVFQHCRSCPKTAPAASNPYVADHAERLRARAQSLGAPGPSWISYFGSEVLRPLPDLSHCRNAFRKWGKCPAEEIRWLDEFGKIKGMVERLKAIFEETSKAGDMDEKLETKLKKCIEAEFMDEELQQMLVEHKLDKKKSPCELFDLSGLSWRGLDLVSPATVQALNGIDDRRKALIEMLNGLQADIDPNSGAKPYLTDLSTAVYGAIQMIIADSPKNQTK